MNTEQNYVGRGNYANTLPPMAQNAAKTPSKPDSRQADKPEFIEVSRKVYDAQTKLLALVDDFMQSGGASGPIEVINDLLYRWLTTPTTDLINLPSNRNQLFTAFELVYFLAKAYEQLGDIQYFIELEKEVASGE